MRRAEPAEGGAVDAGVMGMVQARRRAPVGPAPADGLPARTELAQRRGLDEHRRHRRVHRRPVRRRRRLRRGLAAGRRGDDEVADAQRQLAAIRCASATPPAIALADRAAAVGGSPASDAGSAGGPRARLRTEDAATRCRWPRPPCGRSGPGTSVASGVGDCGTALALGILQGAFDAAPRCCARPASWRARAQR